MANRIPILAANWKMHKTLHEMEEFFSTFLPLVQGIKDREIFIAPSFVYLKDAIGITVDSEVKIVAQNMYHEEQGAFTGEVSPLMLRSIQVENVILGHSERRHIFGESDELIAKKVKSAVSHGLSAILCIGETLQEREAGHTHQVLSSQLNKGLELLSDQDFPRVSVAYEPVWAIGTGQTASIEQIQEAHSLVRKGVKDRAGQAVAQQMRILYGGSVKPGNVRQIMALEDVDGALVGGASLEPESFARIVKFEEN